MLKDFPDHTSAAGAMRLADRIAAYWRAQSEALAVQVWVEPIWGESGHSRRASRYRVGNDTAVRSNLVGGLPPRRSDHIQ